jgi:two-component system sensor histidine kinase SenX3
VSPASLVLLLLGAVALLGAGIVAGLVLGRRRAGGTGPAAGLDADAATDQQAPAGQPPAAAGSGPYPAHRIGAEAVRLIRDLPGIVILVGDDGRTGYASPDADRLGLVRRNRLAFDEMARVARQAQRGQSVEVREIAVRRPPLNKALLDLRVRAVPMGSAAVLLLVDDLSEERRVAMIRRDFIANVSHELKTPVGAISLLAEALVSARDDPAAVQHFAQRLHTEAGRLGNLISDVIDLSRLQGEDPLAQAAPCSIDQVVAEAVDFVRSAAEAKSIAIVVGGTHGLRVVGMHDQLVTAVRNLLTNAVAYSPEHTRVAVAVRQRGARVEIAVKDQGMGIEDADQDRIFERFYRVDAARSRVTGGTGLGLAIVRNVCRNHGGDVYVWSVRGEGSTFTVQLPVQVSAGAPADQGNEQAIGPAGMIEGIR